MSAGPTPGELASARQTVLLLNGQATSLQLELRRLQQLLGERQGEVVSARFEDLLQANEQLVLAALHADLIAVAAVDKLDELTRTSQRDPLTGTPNRTLMLDRIHEAIVRARRHQTRCALLFLDVDDFKHINDHYGHDVGDEVVILVAHRLAALVRESDTIARHGGDEFVILLAELAAASDAALVASKIIAGMTLPCALHGHSVCFTASVGIAIWPDDGEDAATLIRKADEAMYSSKRNCRGGYAFYSAPNGEERPIVPAETFSTRAPPAVQPGPSVARLEDLRDANERLVISALAAQEKELGVKSEHFRQIKFIAMVAHELRSPLAPLGTAAELLRHAATDESLLARLQAIIKRQVMHMTRLVDDLLDGSRATTGKFRLERLTVDLVDVLAHAVEVSRSMILQRQQKLTVRIPPGPCLIDGDAVRLMQVFSNLLDNAAKYTPVGGEISLEAAVHGMRLEVVVADNGIGISPEALASVFDLFVQEDHAVRVNKTGLGIGLAVVRDLIRGHGGEVVCESSGRGMGSRFTVSLPLIQGGPEAV